MKKILILSPLLLVFLIVFPPLDSGKIKGQGRTESIFSVQMHLHGSLSEKLGTMAWHTQQAERSGIDVLWWSDHDQMVNLFKEDFKSFYNFESGSLHETDPEDITGRRGKGWHLKKEDIFKDPFPFSQAMVTHEQAYTGQFAFKMFGVSGSTGSWQTLGYRYFANGDAAIRSLLSEVSLNIAIYPVGPVTPDTLIFVQVALSQDLNLQPNFLYYVLSPNPPVSSPNSIFIPLPYQENQWNFYTLPITADAITYFPTLKDDQSLHETTLGIASRNLAQVTAFFDDFRINTNGAKGEALLALQRAVLKTRYSSVITHHVGNEITNPLQVPILQFGQGEERIHLNALGEKVPLIDYNHFNTLDYPKSAVDHVHKYGGIISYNHMFGYNDKGLPPGMTPEKLKEEVKARLLARKVYGADLLEVGYVKRQLLLKDFLEVWDALSMANIFVTGTGVTDDHGGSPWSKETNRFVTWVYAPSKSEEDLIAGLKSGKAFFGDPFAFNIKGKLDLTTPEGFRMGQTVITPLTGHQVTVDLNGLAAGDLVKLVENGVVTQQIQASGVSLQKSFRVDTSLPKVVRIEVYGQDGIPKVFSNPIYLLKALPPGGLPVERVVPLSGRPVLVSANYSGSGGTDMAVWRPSQGLWLALLSSGKVLYQPWGLPGDIPVPGDYDGDGKTDMAVWRPLEGNWYILRSSAGIDKYALGNFGDVPVPGDYDGDGRVDRAVWRPAGGLWSIQGSSGGTRTIRWGRQGDIPVPGDYDGDGKTDLGIWRPSKGTWFLLLSSGRAQTESWGQFGDIPVSGDYDGDGVFDPGVWSPDSGTWQVRLSSGGTLSQNLGGQEDIPVPGDYDKDGRTDIAVWTPDSGIWTIFQSSDGKKTQQLWGQKGDVPVSR